MSDFHDLIIVGAGPGGLAAASLAKKGGLRAVVLEKGKHICQGIVDSYPRGKKVYPTVPKQSDEPFLVDFLRPPDKKLAVEEYLAQVEGAVGNMDIDIRFEEEFTSIEKMEGGFRVKTRDGHYDARRVLLAFGSNIPNDLGIYGEAKTVARSLENPEDYIGVHCLVIGGGNTAADVVSSISRTKRAADDSSPVYWAHRRESFSVDKDVARDLGEEILLGGQIKVLQGAIPRIGEVDDDGMERLIIRAHGWPWGDVLVTQGFSFPMKHVIALIGTHGPEPIFETLGLSQISCIGGVCKIGREGSKLLILNSNFETTTKGVYAIGGAICPVYAMQNGNGEMTETRHSNLIHTAVNDGAKAVKGILKE